MDQHAEVVGFRATVARYPLCFLHCLRLTQKPYLPNAFRMIRQLLQVKCNRGGMITVAMGMTGIKINHQSVIMQTVQAIDLVGPLPPNQPLFDSSPTERRQDCPMPM